MPVPRLRPATPQERAADFWRWWPTARDRLRREVEASAPGEAHLELARRVAAIDRRLGWLVEPGSTARLRLLLDPPLGHPSIRGLAGAWHAAAPRADGVWEFGPSRPARRDLPRIEVEDGWIETAEIRVEPAWNADREVVDLRVWHPVFGELAEREPGAAVYVVLDALVALLGADDVDRWLGALELDPLPDGAMRLPALREWLARASSVATRNRWLTVMRRNQRGEPVAFRFNAALKRIDHPGASDLVAVDMPRRADRVEAAEAPGITDALRDLERDLGAGVVKASEVSEPSRLTVTYATPDGMAAARTVDRWSAARRGTWAEARLVSNPEWATVGDGAEDPASASTRPLITPRPTSAIDRRTRWIERHPWRLIGGPLAVGAALVLVGAVVPGLAAISSTLFIAVFGVGAIAVGVYVLALQYLAMREHAAVGCLSLLLHGWIGAAALGVGFLALVVALLSLQYGGG